MPSGEVRSADRPNNPQALQLHPKTFGRGCLTVDVNDCGRLPFARRRNRWRGISHLGNVVLTRDPRDRGIRSAPKIPAHRDPSPLDRRPTWRSSKSTGGEREGALGHRARVREAHPRIPRRPRPDHRSHPQVGGSLCTRCGLWPVRGSPKRMVEPRQEECQPKLPETKRPTSTTSSRSECRRHTSSPEATRISSHVHFVGCSTRPPTENDQVAIRDGRRGLGRKHRPVPTDVILTWRQTRVAIASAVESSRDLHDQTLPASTPFDHMPSTVTSDRTDELPDRVDLQLPPCSAGTHGIVSSNNSG